MTFEEAKGVLKTLVNDGVRMGDLEEELKIPKNHLSGYLSGNRKTPPKWQEKLIDYAKRVEKVRKPEPKILLPARKKAAGTAPPKKKAQASDTPPVQTLPPAGLSRSEKMKWFRQNNQTLQ